MISNLVRNSEFGVKIGKNFIFEFELGAKLRMISSLRKGRLWMRRDLILRT